MLLEMCDSVKYFYSLQTHHIQCDHLTPYQIQCISPMGINKCFFQSLVIPALVTQIT
jgi:hypothetical protein